MENFNNWNNVEWNNSQNVKYSVFWDLERNIFMNKIVESKFIGNLINSKFFNRSNNFINKNEKTIFSLFWILIIAYSIFIIVNNIFHIISNTEGAPSTIKYVSILFTILIYWIFIFLWFWVIKKQRWIPNLFALVMILWIANFLAQIIKLLSNNLLTINALIFKIIPLLIFCIMTLYIIKNKELFNK